jgi:hypothetical protein
MNGIKETITLKQGFALKIIKDGFFAEGKSTPLKKNLVN